MSSSDRRNLILGASAALGLGACGFTPVYGPGGAAEGLRGRIRVEPPRDVAGFAFVRHLEARLGLPEAPRYVLEAQIAREQSRLGVTAGQETTRISILGRVRFILRDIESGRVATQGQVENFTSYSATGTPFATEAAREDAQQRLMVILADQVIARLLVTSDRWAQ